MNVSLRVRLRFVVDDSGDVVDRSGISGLTAGDGLSSLGIARGVARSSRILVRSPAAILGVILSDFTGEICGNLGLKFLWMTISQDATYLFGCAVGLRIRMRLGVKGEVLRREAPKDVLTSS